MKMAQKEECRVVCFEHPAGIISGCIACKKVLRTGQWAVGLFIGTDKYVVGVDPPLTCCGAEKKVIDTVDTEEEAKALMQRVIEQLNEDGTTENLKLYEAHPIISVSIH